MNASPGVKRALRKEEQRVRDQREHEERVAQGVKDLEEQRINQLIEIRKEQAAEEKAFDTKLPKRIRRGSRGQ